MKIIFCLGVFTVGLLTGAVFAGTWDYFVPYRSREEAIGDGLQSARRHCAEFAKGRKVRCNDVRMVGIEEEKDGWWMEFVSSDYAGTDRVFIGRQGEYAAGGDWLN